MTAHGYLLGGAKRSSPPYQRYYHSMYVQLKSTEQNIKLNCSLLLGSFLFLGFFECQIEIISPTYLYSSFRSLAMVCNWMFDVPS